MTEKIGFRQKLAERQRTVNSLVCVGLDPLPERIPAGLDSSSAGVAERVQDWMIGIVEATAPYACMFKPQSAHWEAIKDGRQALQSVIAHIHLRHPEIPVFLDVKRGDIGRTQEQYQKAHFELDGADGMNYNPYMGQDCLTSLVDPNNLGRALVGICRTSNPLAWLVQDQRMTNGLLVWEHIAQLVLAWSREAGVLADAGLVMGAAHKDPHKPDKIYSWHLKQCRHRVGDDLWFLIPGIGAQGGFIEETVEHAFVGSGSIAINSSSGIIFASDGEDHAELAGVRAEQLRNQIRAAGGDLS